MRLKTYEKFITQFTRFKNDEFNITRDQIKYDAGYVTNDFIVTREQMGAEKTFSIGMPVYDENEKFLGYLINDVFDNLNSCFYDNTNKCITKDDLGNEMPSTTWKVHVIRARQEEIKNRDYTKIKTYWQVFYKKELLENMMKDK